MSCDGTSKCTLFNVLNSLLSNFITPTLYAGLKTDEDDVTENDFSDNVDTMTDSNGYSFTKVISAAATASDSKSSNLKKTISDRGKTGAGVAGSRGNNEAPKECSDEAAAAAAGVPGGAVNPGLLRYIHNAARHRLPQCFEGAYFSAKQTTNTNWMIGHTMSFSSVSPGGYKLMLSYADKAYADKPDEGRDKFSSLPYFVMEMAPGGQMSCEARVSPTSGTRAAVVAQISDAELYSFESIVDTYFRNATASFIAVNREFVALHFLQAINEKFSMGMEVVARGNVAGLSSATAAARWADDKNSLSATLGNRGIDVCYAKVVQPFLTVAAMLEVGLVMRRAVATIAYEWELKDWSCRASFDSDGLIGATVQRALGGKHARLSYAVSALLNHKNDKFKLGFGVTGAVL